MRNEMIDEIMYYAEEEMLEYGDIETANEIIEDMEKRWIYRRIDYPTIEGVINEFKESYGVLE